MIYIDDYYNASWPGVQEGVAKYYLSQAARFVPLLFTCNKLFLCNLSYHACYLEKVRSFLHANFPETAVKPVRRFGFDTLTVIPNMQSGRFMAANPVW
jgi:hypothetical protein